MSKPIQTTRTAAQPNSHHVPSLRPSHLRLPHRIEGWCLHGWCTQRPKIPSADKTAEEERRRGWFTGNANVGQRQGEELLCGPEYIGSGSRDMEGDDDKYIEYGYPMGRERFKWPSISLAERQGYRYRRPPPSEDDA